MKIDLAVNFFETFSVPAIYLMFSNVGGIYSEGKTSGLVLDSGLTGTYSLNVFEGYPVMDTLQRSSQGGLSVT